MGNKVSVKRNIKPKLFIPHERRSEMYTNYLESLVDDINADIEVLNTKVKGGEDYYKLKLELEDKYFGFKLAEMHGRIKETGELVFLGRQVVPNKGTIMQRLLREERVRIERHGPIN